jgi:hypothetical protein
MQAIYGQKSSFTGSDANLKFNIEDLVSKYPDFQFPLLKRLNSGNFKNEVNSYKYEWQEKDARPVKAGVVNQIAAIGASIAVDTAGVFKPDDVAVNLRTGEKMLVTAVAGGTLLTVERGFEGTLATIVVEADELVRIGTAAPEGAASGNGLTYNGDEIYNYTQIFRDYVEMSDGQYKGFIRGDETKSDQIERIQKELMEGFGSSVLIGNRSRNFAEKRSTLGGVKFMVDTYAPANVTDFGGASTWASDTAALAKFEDAVQTLALRMAAKPTIYASYKALRKVRLLQDDTFRGTNKDKARGIGVVDTLMTGMGELDIVQVIDRTGIMDNYIFLVDESKVGYKARKGRGWFVEEKPFNGDGHLWQVLGEYTVKVDNPKNSIAYINNLGV